MNLRKYLCVSLFFVLFLAAFSNITYSQGRERVVNSSMQPPPEMKTSPIRNPLVAQRQIPTLTNNIVVQKPSSLIKKTGSSQPIGAVVNNTFNRSVYAPAFSQKLLSAINERIGIPYRYGSSGPSTYDCSGLVWSVFEDAGFYFDRTSARSIWQESEEVDGSDRYKFGTLVFFNGLGHIGIVADENGFYHASLSKGVTYSKFEGYWEKRIVGFRRLDTVK